MQAILYIMLTVAQFMFQYASSQAQLWPCLIDSDHRQWAQDIFMLRMVHFMPAVNSGEPSPSIFVS